MESGQMSLEDSLTAYKRGNTLLEFCQKSLADVEQQVKILNERQQLAPFNAENE
jgi:exodeoxyribonuclease VII small subunit